MFRIAELYNLILNERAYFQEFLSASKIKSG